MNNYDGAATLYSTYRIYRAKISEGSEMIRDYVPAYDDLKQRPCMYDLVNNVAYYNDGTGEFVMPPKREGSYTGYAQLGGIGNRLGSVDRRYYVPLNYIRFEDMDEETKTLFRSATSIKDNIFYDATKEILGRFNTQGLLTGTNIGPDHLATDGKSKDTLLSPHNYSAGLSYNRSIPLVSFESDLNALENGINMFAGCNTLVSFDANLDSLKYGYGMFTSCKFASFDNDLPKLVEAEGMFSGCSNLISFNSDLSSLENGEDMFGNTQSLISFNSDMPKIKNVKSMFDNSNINEFNGDMSSLEVGDYMFNFCYNLSSFRSNLQSLRSAYYMFDNTMLDAASVENILLSIPAYNDGETHKLTMCIQATTATAKFNEITGLNIPETIRWVNPQIVTFKGWTIEVTTEQLK